MSLFLPTVDDGVIFLHDGARFAVPSIAVVTFSS